MRNIFIRISLLTLILLVGCSPPEEVSVNIDHPNFVSVGEEFEFVVTLNNEDSKIHYLESVDIDLGFLNGIMVTSTDPNTKEEDIILGQQIFEFMYDVPANSEQGFMFHAKALKTGDFSGRIDVCIDGPASCVGNVIRIIVE